MIDDTIKRMRDFVAAQRRDIPIIAHDDISVGDISDLLSEIDRLSLEVESERQRLGDECDRLVIEWAEYAQGIHNVSRNCESKSPCPKCGGTQRIVWGCDECHGNDYDKA